MANNLASICNKFLDTYDNIGMNYDEKKMKEVIEFYNENLMLIALNNLAPCNIIDSYNIDTYRFAYSAIYMATANIRSKLV